MIQQKRKKQRTEADGPPRKKIKQEKDSNTESWEIVKEGDFANVTHHKPYTEDIPVYRHCSKGAFILGAHLSLIETADILDLDRIKEEDLCDLSWTLRYFSTLQQLRFRDKGFEQVHIVERSWDPDGVRKGLLGLVLTQAAPKRNDKSWESDEVHFPSDSNAGSQTLDDYMYKVTSDLNGKTRSDPMNTQAWCSLADFQKFMPRAKNGQTDRVLSIYKKALEYNSTSDRLLVRLLRTASDLPDKADVLWDQKLREHPNKPLLYNEYFKYRMGLPNFSVTTHRDICAYCMKVLRAARNKLVAKTKFHDGHGFFYDLSSIEQTCWTVYLDLMTLERQAGYLERATAMLQAIVEFNFFTPPNLMIYEERITYFEAFWESETPRIGEPGALGWRQWQYLFKQDMNPNPEDAEPFPNGNISRSKHVLWTKEGTHLVPKELPSGVANRWVRKWLKNEENLGVYNWLPYHGNPSETEDFERFVMFDDIKELLFEVTDETLKQKILVDSLEALGIEDSVISLGLRSERPSDSPQELFETMPNFNQCIQPYASPKDAEELTRRQYQKADVEDQADALSWLKDNLGLDMEDSQPQPSLVREVDDQNVIFAWNMFQLLQNDRETLCLKGLSLGLECANKGIECGRKLAKKLLKKEPTNLRLWHIYAQMEFTQGRLKDARRVYKIALKQLGGVPQSEGRYAPLIFWHCFETEVARLGPDAKPARSAVCWDVLLSCAEGVYNPMKKEATIASIPKTRILKAQQRFMQLLQSQDGLIWKCESLVYRNQTYQDLGSVPVPAGVYLGLCYAYLTLFTADVHEAKKVIKTYVLPKVSYGIPQDWVLNELQILVELGARSGPGLHEVVTSTLLESLEKSPQHTGLLKKVLIHINAIPRFKLGLFFDGLLENSDDSMKSSLGYLYLIAHELKQNSDVTRLRSLFEKNMSLLHGHKSVALWRLYTVLELNQWDKADSRDQPSSIAKDVWYRAIHSCSWSKQLFLDGFRWFGPLFSEDELLEIFKLMSDKEIRLRSKLRS